MTFEDVVVAALGLASRYQASVPPTRSPLFRRLGVRQDELFHRAAQVEPSFFGRRIVRPVAAGVVDFSDADPPIARISEITVWDGGDSPFPAGHPVEIVRPSDLDDAFPPRVLREEGQLVGVVDDLEDVVSLALHYSRAPAPVSITENGEREVELPSGYADLLVLDLARWIVAQDAGLPKAGKEGAVAQINSDESALIEGFDRHVAGFSNVTSRH